MTAEDRAEPHIAAAVREIMKGNNNADGDYIIVICPVIEDGSMGYTWQWFWSPKAPNRRGPE